MSNSLKQFNKDMGQFNSLSISSCTFCSDLGDYIEFYKEVKKRPLLQNTKQRICRADYHGPPNEEPRISKASPSNNYWALSVDTTEVTWMIPNRGHSPDITEMGSLPFSSS